MLGLDQERDGDIMPIKPVDFQISVPRTVEVSRNQNDNINKAHAINKLQNEKLNDESYTSLKQVQHRERLYKSENREKQKGRGSSQSNSNGKNEELNDENGTNKKNPKENNERSVHIDIRV